MKVIILCIDIAVFTFDSDNPILNSVFCELLQLLVFLLKLNVFKQTCFKKLTSVIKLR